MQHRIEDQFIPFQAHLEPKICAIVNNLIDSIGHADARPVGTLATEMTRRGRDELCKNIEPLCLRWLLERKCWSDVDADLTNVAQEIESGVLQLPYAEDCGSTEDAITISAHSWAVPAAIGAGLGALAFAPLTWYALENRYIGLFLGGIIGAYGLVRLLALVATTSYLQSVLQIGAASAGLVSVFNGLRAGLGGFSWLKTTLAVTGGLVILSLIRPQRPPVDHAEQLARVRSRLLRQLRFDAAMILAFCWAHPDRSAAIGPANASPKCISPDSFSSALGELGDAWRANISPEELHDALEEFFQRLGDQGFEVQTLPTGAVFAETMQEAFDTYGLILPGNPVRTCRAALRYQGAIIRKGEIRRL